MDKPRKSKKGKKSKKRAAAGLPSSVKGLLRYMEGSQAQISRTPRSTAQAAAGAGVREAQNIKIKLNIGALPQQQVASALASATAPLIAARQQAAAPPSAATAEVKSIARQLGEETLARQKLELGVQREVFGVEQKLAQQASSLRKEFSEEALKFLQPERQLARITLPPPDAPAIGEEVVKIKRARRSRPVEVKEERIEVAVQAPTTEVEQQKQQEQYEKFMPGQFLGIGATGEIVPPMSVGLEKYKANAPTGEIVLKDKPKKANKMPKKVPLYRVEATEAGTGGFVSSTEQTVRQDIASRVAGMKQKLMSVKATKPNPNLGGSAGSFAEIIEQQKAASAKQQPLFSAEATKFAATASAAAAAPGPARSPFSVKETSKLFSQLTGGQAPKFRTSGAGSRKTVQAFSAKLNTLSKTGANAQQIKELMAEFPTAFEGSVESS
jgi:hypothetical protein